MSGLKNKFGYLCMTPTILLSNSPILAQPFEKFVCVMANMNMEK